MYDQHVTRRAAGHVRRNRAKQPARQRVQPAVADDQQADLVLVLRRAEPTTVYASSPSASSASATSRLLAGWYAQTRQRADDDSRL